MSCSLSCDAKPCMMGFGRLPPLNSCSCLKMYSGCCCASLGFAGVPELPPTPWQATHTEENFASPAARSGVLAAVATPSAFGAGAAGVAAAGPGAGAELDAAGGATVRPEAPVAAAVACGAAALAAGCWAEIGSTVAASKAASSKETGVLITFRCLCGAKPEDSTMPH